MAYTIQDALTTIADAKNKYQHQSTDKKLSLEDRAFAYERYFALKRFTVNKKFTTITDVIQHLRLSIEAWKTAADDDVLPLRQRAIYEERYLAVKEVGVAIVIERAFDANIEQYGPFPQSVISEN